LSNGMNRIKSWPRATVRV